MGLAARYVSGYLETRPPPGQERLQGADRSHAWLSVYVPGNGWVDADPTNNQMPPQRHLAIAWGRDYADVTPLKGVIFGGGTHTLEVAVDVVRLG
jgi:transglutaminase-like putative cysteine protease